MFRLLKKRDNVAVMKKTIFLLTVILIFTLFLTTNVRAGPAAPSFTVDPADDPDPVNQGDPVTFTATATDSNGDPWYLAICTTEAVTGVPLAPPTCDVDKYCVSTSFVDSGLENSCIWTSEGSGVKNWYGFACDHSNQGLCSGPIAGSITVTSAPIDDPPTITLNSPVDIYNTNSSTIDFNCTASDDIKLENVSLYGNWSTEWHLNQTNSSPENATPVIFTETISDGYYVWNCQACDNKTTTQCSFDDNRTFTVDTTAPTITLPVYTNATPYRNDQSMIYNISVIDAGIGADYCSINVASEENVTVIVNNGWCNGTYSLAGISEGNQTINAYANDTLNNWGLNDSYVVWIDNTGPSLSNEGANETNITQNSYFCLNITVTDIPSGVDTVYAEVWNTTHWLNYTMTDTETSCGGDEDDVYGVEIHGTSQGIWNYSKAHANDTLNNWDSSDFSDLTINVTAPADDNFPQFSNPQENPGNNSNYSYGQSYQFNSTVTYTNGTIYLSFNNTNYSASNVSDEFYVDFDSLSAGTYNYFWWGYGNGSQNMYNSSDTKVYVIQKINPIASLTNTDDWTVTYPEEVTINYSESNDGDDDVIYKIFRDGEDKGGEETITLGYGDYNYILNTTGGINYTINSTLDNQTLTINQNTSSCSVLFNKSSPINYSTIFRVWTNCTSGFVLYRNETPIENNSTQNLAANSYNFTVIRNDTVNYSNYYDEQTFIVQQAIGEVATHIDNVRNNKSILLNSEKWLNATLITGVGDIKLYYNNTLINQGASPLSNLTNFTSEEFFNVSGIYDGNENYTSDIETWWVNVSTDSAPTLNIIYPENIIYNLNVSVLNYTVEDDIDLSHCWYSLNEGETNSSPDTDCSNHTDLTSSEGPNTWIVYANDSTNQIGSDSVTFTKDTTSPTFSNYLRAPTTSNEDEDIQVNVTITETNLDKVILEFNNGTAVNYTVTTSNENEYYFTILQGNYSAHDSITYYWYANDTATNMNKSSQQSFTVANQIPSVSQPAINDETPQTNDVISCDGGTISDDDEYDSEGGREFKWYDNDTEVSGQTSQTLDLSVPDLDKGDIIKCSIRVNDSYNWSNWVNSSNTAIIQNSPPTITNQQTTVNKDADGTPYNYDYEATDPDSGESFTWYDNTTLFNISSETGIISDTPTEDEAGTYSISINVSDGTVNATDDFTYTINDTTSPSIDFQPPTEEDEAQLTRNYIQVNVTASDGKAIDIINITLYNSTSLVQSNTSSTSPFFVNFTNLPDENYYFNATVNDTSNNLNQTDTKTVSTDTGPPTINYVSPTQDSGVYKSQNYVEVNVTAGDPNLDKIIIRLYNSAHTQIDSATTSSSPNFANFTGLSNGLYYYNATANDTFGNDESLATKNITLDTIVPLINFTTGTEENATTHSRNWIFVNVSVNETNEDTITFSLYNETALVDETPYTNEQRTRNWTDLPNGIYYYNVSLNDTAGNSNSTKTRTIILDTEGPQVSLLTESPNDPANYSEGGIYMFNATVYDPSLDVVWVDFNGTNYTATHFVGYIYNITLSDLSVGNYSYRWYANDSFDNLNDSENETYTINQGVPNLTLTITPSNNVDYPTETTANGTGCPSQLTCNLYRDGISVSNEETIILGVGTYNYTYNVTGNTNYTSASVSDNLTITQNTGSCSVLFNDSSVTYGTSFLVWTNCTSGFVLYRNETAIVNNSPQNLAADSYNFTVVRNDTVNYSNIYDEETFVVQQAIGEVYTYLDNLRANKTIEQFTEIYLNGTLETGQTGESIKLYKNGTLIHQGVPPLYNLTNFTTIGLFNITTTYDGNENYTSDFETWWVNVTEADVTPPQISITYPQNNTNYTSIQTQLNYTAWDNIGLNFCWYSLNEGETNSSPDSGCSNHTDLTSSEGSNIWTVYANDSKGNENSSSVTFFVDSIAPTINFESPTEISGTSLGRNYIQINVTASDTNLANITIRLYNSTKDLVRTNISTSPFFINYTGLSADIYFFNATANDTLNNQDSTETKNVTLVLPSLTIHKPKNETYIIKKNLPLKYIANYEDTVEYNIDLGSNTLITSNTTFNTTEGSQTLYLYANNSVGTTTKNVTFIVNLTKFIIYYDEYKGSNKGNSTDFNASSYEDLQNLSGVVLENIDYGKISFNESINLTDDANLSDNNVDLDINVNISDNRIEINSTALPNFNKSATLYFYDLSSVSKKALRDEQECSSEICTTPVYSAGTWSFNVTGFTVYSLEDIVGEEAPPGAPSAEGGAGYECLDNSDCEGKDEICWNHKCVELFDIKIIDFESPVKLGDFFDFTYLIKGMADINDDVEVQFWIEKNGEKITSGSDTIYLGSFEEKIETTKIFLPSNVKSGTYVFYVQVIHQAYQAKSHRTIQIEVKEGLAKIISAPKDFKTYVICFLIALIIIILFFIFYLERKKIRAKFMQEEKWIKKHKLLLLVLSLFIVLIILAFCLNLFGLISNLIFKIILWFRINIPFSYFYYGLGVIFALVILVSLTIIVKKKKLFKRFKEWIGKTKNRKFLRKRRADRLSQKKYKAEIKKSEREFKKISKISDRLGEKLKDYLIIKPKRGIKLLARILKKSIVLFIGLIKKCRREEKKGMKLMRRLCKKRRREELSRRKKERKKELFGSKKERKRELSKKRRERKEERIRKKREKKEELKKRKREEERIRKRIQNIFKSTGIRIKKTAQFCVKKTKEVKSSLKDIGKDKRKKRERHLEKKKELQRKKKLIRKRKQFFKKKREVIEKKKKISEKSKRLEKRKVKKIRRKIKLQNILKKNKTRIKKIKEFSKKSIKKISKINIKKIINKFPKIKFPKKYIPKPIIKPEKGLKKEKKLKVSKKDKIKKIGKSLKNKFKLLKLPILKKGKYIVKDKKKQLQTEFEKDKLNFQDKVNKTRKNAGVLINKLTGHLNNLISLKKRQKIKIKEPKKKVIEERKLIKDFFNKGITKKPAGKPAEQLVKEVEKEKKKRINLAKVGNKLKRGVTRTFGRILNYTKSFSSKKITKIRNRLKERAKLRKKFKLREKPKSAEQLVKEVEKEDRKERIENKLKRFLRKIKEKTFIGSKERSKQKNLEELKEMFEEE